MSCEIAYSFTRRGTSPREQGSELHSTHTEDYAAYLAELSKSFLKHFKSLVRDFVVNTDSGC